MEKASLHLCCRKGKLSFLDACFSVKKLFWLSRQNGTILHLVGEMGVGEMGLTPGGLHRCTVIALGDCNFQTPQTLPSFLKSKSAHTYIHAHVRPEAICTVSILPAIYAPQTVLVFLSDGNILQHVPARVPLLML